MEAKDSLLSALGFALFGYICYINTTAVAVVIYSYTAL